MDKWVHIMGALPFVTMNTETAKLKPYWGKLIETAVLVMLAYIAASSSFGALKTELQDFKFTVTEEIREMKIDFHDQIFEVKLDIKEFRDDFYDPVIKK